MYMPARFSHMRLRPETLGADIDEEGGATGAGRDRRQPHGEKRAVARH